MYVPIDRIPETCPFTSFAMDLFLFGLLIMLVSVLLNVILLCCLMHQCHRAVGHEPHDGDEHISTVLKTEGNLKQRSINITNEVVILPKSGKAYHRPSCMHVQMAKQKCAETKQYSPCKTCFQL